MSDARSPVFTVRIPVAISMSPGLAFRLGRFLVDTLPQITPAGKIPDAQLMALGHTINGQLQTLHNTCYDLFLEE